MTKTPDSADTYRKVSPILGRDKLISLSLAALVVLLGSLLIVEGVTGVDHDDGIYVVTAKALAQDQGYRLIHMPDAPFQTKYPFFYPALLAVIWKLFPAFPANLYIMQWLTLLAGGATGAFSYLYLIRFQCCSRLVATAIVLLTVTLPGYLFLSTVCMSEMPFALALISALWVFGRHLESPLESRKSQLFLGVLLALPMLFRTIGFVVVFVVIYYALKDKKNMRWPAVGTSLVVLLYGVWLLRFSIWNSATTNTSYYTNYLSWWQSYCIPLLSRILASNAFDICQGFFKIHLFRWTSIPDWVSWLAVLIGLLGIGNIARQIGKQHAMPIFLLVYLAVVLVWPWPPFRFLFPVLPFLYCYSFAAVTEIFKNKSRFLKPLGFTLLGALLIANASAVHKDLEVGAANHYPGYMLNLQSSTVEWSSYQDMFDWIRQNSKSSDLFISGIDPMLYLYTGRRSVRPFSSRPSSMYYKDTAPVLGSLSEVMANIRFYKPQYLVLSPMPGLPEEIPYVQFIVESQKEYRGWLERVYLGKDKRFAIWKIVG
jgi:hypothetical protein